MTNELESPEIATPQAKAFSFPNAGASDNAAGVGARLHLSPSLSRGRGYLMSIATSAARA